MNNRGKSPLEEELRSSQVYQTLTSSGSYVAGKIAQGLGKAAGEIDKVVKSSGHPGSSVPPGGNYYPPNQGAGAPRPNPNPQPRPNPNPQPNGYYRYQNQPQPPRQNPNPRRPVYTNPPPPGYAPHGHVRQPVRPPAGVTPVAAPQMKMVRRKSNAKFYITAATALLYALTGPLYTSLHFLIFALVEVLVFFLSGALFKGKKEWVPLTEAPPAPKVEKKEEPGAEEKSTGNPEVDKVIREGRDYLKQLRAANDAIPDESMSECIDRMERSSADIFAYISEHPEKAPQIRKFMNYYLPTTLKLLKSYQRLASQNVKGENVTSTMFNISGMMHTVAAAFEKQLDSLFDDEAMDISADITVFETLLKQEGFVDEKEKSTGKQN